MFLFANGTHMRVGDDPLQTPSDAIQLRSLIALLVACFYCKFTLYVFFYVYSFIRLLHAFILCITSLYLLRDEIEIINSSV